MDNKYELIQKIKAILEKNNRFADYKKQLAGISKISQDPTDLLYCLEGLLEIEDKEENKELIKKYEDQIDEWFGESLKYEFDKKEYEIVNFLFGQVKEYLPEYELYQKRVFNLPSFQDLDNLIHLVKRFKRVKKLQLSDTEKTELRNQIKVQIDEWFYTNEHQIKPEALKKSIDTSAGVNSRFFFTYIAAIAFIAISTGSVTDMMLLLNSPFQLPVVKVKIPLFGFFLIMPLALIAMHMNLLFNFHQHLVKLRHYFKTNRSRRKMEDLIVHPFLLNFTEVESIGTFSKLILKFLNWAFLFIIPIFQLVWIQITFSKYQDKFLVNWHIGCLLIDLFVLFVYWHRIQEETEEENFLKFHFDRGFFAFFGRPVAKLLGKNKAEREKNIHILERIPGIFYRFLSNVSILFILFLSGSNAYYTYSILQDKQTTPTIKSYSLYNTFLFPRLKIENRTIRDINLEDRNFKYANFFRVRFENVSLKYADLRRANIILCDTEKANFYLSKMEGVNPPEIQELSKINRDIK